MEKLKGVNRKGFCMLVAFFVVLVLVCFVEVHSAVAGDAQKINLSAAHVMSEKDPYHLGIAKFCELVTERTNERIGFTLYPSGQLGAERDITEGVSMGTIDVAVVTNAFCVNLAPELGVLDFPYLFRSKADAYKLLDSEIGTELFKNLERSKIIGLAYMENGFRNLNTRNSLITTPDQIKGVKIRTMETPVHLAAFNAAGANATPVSAAELYTDLQQGTVLGHENPLKSIYDYHFYEVCPYVSKTEHFYSSVNLIINKGVWDSISAEDRAIMRQAAKEATDYSALT
jgi:tripartite ATP-independent transporter DctP family solute receptor